jgi:hypothetical protein
MGNRRSYTDASLVTAVAEATSWRGVLRALGLSATSSGAIRSVKERAVFLDLDTSHFTGQRRWSDDALSEAVAIASSWHEVLGLLGLSSSSDIALVKGHACRLGIDASHLVPAQQARAAPLAPNMGNIDRAGSLVAAAWFTMCGLNVSWPLEPSRYDLLVQADGNVRRIQVKTTRTWLETTWKVYLSTSRRGRRIYDPDEIDEFFVIDGDFNCYAIPVAVVGGLHAIHLSAYSDYQVPHFMSPLTDRGGSG